MTPNIITDWSLKTGTKQDTWAKRRVNQSYTTQMSLFSILSELSSAAESFEYRGREWFRGFLHSISTECLNQTLTNVFSLTLPEHLISPLCFILLFCNTALIFTDLHKHRLVSRSACGRTFSRHNTHYMFAHTPSLSISLSHTHNIHFHIFMRTNTLLQT